MDTPTIDPTVGSWGAGVSWAQATLVARLRRPSPRAARRRCGGDWGEGVISAAIAVLIMAFLGAAMWVGFQQMWKSTEATTNDKIEQIGSE
ncbi:MAG: hypothetical protein MUE36_04850 [Acidimicrobiales bacterium]|jgi:hypothetical protein|nr:hypothetical protein [Acidimicrobiales bacterium]